MAIATGTALAVAAVAGLASSYMSSEAGRKGRDQAEDFHREAMARLQAVGIPAIEAQKMLPQIVERLQDFTPEQLETVSQDPSALEKIEGDSRLKQQQMKALNSVSELADKGYGKEDLAAFELARRNSSAEAQARQNSILQQMQTRGLSGSGAELIAALSSGQAASDSLQNSQLQEAVKKADARRSAISELANMSGNMRNQDFSEQTRIADARDAVSRFNAANSQAVKNQNIANQNAAAERNLNADAQWKNAQNAANYNNDLYNKGLTQTHFQNQMQVAGGQNQIGQSMADSAMKNAAIQGAANAGYANAIAGLAGSATKMNLSGAEQPTTPAVTKDQFNTNWMSDNGNYYDDQKAPNFYKGPK